MRKIYRHTISFLTKLIFSLVGFLFFSGLALAADAGLAEVNEAIGLSATDPRIMAGRIIQVVLGFLGIIAVGLIVYAGFLWMTSGGNEEKITQAKNLLKNAVIGLIIILMSFSIASFILRALTDNLGPSKIPTTPPGRRPGGIVVIGGCALERVYPEHMQTEVPRNTSIMVTFKEVIDPASVCSSVSEGKCAEGAVIQERNIHIFRTEGGDFCGEAGDDDCAGNIIDVYAFSKDNRTFVFVPKVYLGSATEYIWHSVKLTDGILTQEGKSAFSGCRDDKTEWRFEVSNIIDLTPPQVNVNGVFPVPDSQRDEVSAGSSATQAEGAIEVKVKPTVFESSKFENLTSGGAAPEAVLSGAYNCENQGRVTVAITADLKTQISGVSGFVSGDPVADKIASLGCGLELKPKNSGASFAAGNSWTFDVFPEKKADKLQIDKTVYTFVSSAEPRDLEITSSADLGAVASGIAKVIADNHRQILTASVVGAKVNLKAVKAGADGNRIVLSAGNPASLIVSAMSGGKDEGAANIKGAKDQPMNTGIRIDFNEAVLPLTLAGDAEELSENIRVKCLEGCGVGVFDPNHMFTCGSDTCIKGKFVTSNQYRTVEFVSNNKCAVNACGEDIYCLPANSRIEVDFNAAPLAACASAGDCLTRAPFSACEGNKCKNSAGDNFPGTDILADYFPKGVMDAAMNSLDGNRNAKAAGPDSFFNENSPNPAEGDSFKWSFFINDKMEVGAPLLEGDVYPGIGYSGADLSKPVEVLFDKILMSVSLLTGSVTIDTGKEKVEHQGVNLKSASSPVGYWIANEIVYEGGYPSKTTVFIKHSGLVDLTSYKAQFGSAIKDIYQNCYLPSGGAGCAASDGSPSCCEGRPSASNFCE